MSPAGYRPGIEKVSRGVPGYSDLERGPPLSLAPPESEFCMRVCDEVGSVGFLVVCFVPGTRYRSALNCKENLYSTIE